MAVRIHFSKTKACSHGVKNILFCLLVLLLWTGSSRAAPFTIGVSLPLSGESAEFGTAVRNGMELALASRPELFRQIRIVYEDNRYDGKTAAGSFIKLTEFDKAQLVLVWGEAPSLVVAPLAERRKTPLIAVLTDPAATKNSRYVIRFINSSQQYAGALAAYLLSQGWNKVGVFLSDDAYYTNYYDALQKQLAGKSARLIKIASFPPGAMDFRTSLSRLADEGVNAFGVLLMPGQISTLYRQARDLSITLPSFGADDFESNNEAQAALGGMEGAVYALNRVSPSFIKRYAGQYGNDVHVTYAANAYEFACLSAELFGREPADNLKAGEIIARFTSVVPRESEMGRMEFRKTAEDGMHFHFPIVVKKIRGKEREIVFAPAD